MNTNEAQCLCGLRREDFQTTINGKKTDLYILKNKSGNEVAITNYGGAIVATEGDYSLALIVPSEVDLNSSFILNGIKNILNKYFSNVSINGNDIFINNLKVAGSTAFGNEKFFFMIFHFSMSDKGNLVSEICGAPKTGKQVGYIDENILSLEKLKEELLLWLQGQ